MFLFVFPNRNSVQSNQCVDIIFSVELISREFQATFHNIKWPDKQALYRNILTAIVYDVLFLIVVDPPWDKTCCAEPDYKRTEGATRV